MDAALEERVARARARNAGHAMVLEQALAKALSRLDAAGIRSLPLKGPTLARTAHGDPALRQSADLDLLVAPAELGRAAETLVAAGYGAPADRLDRSGRPELHLTLAHPEPWGPALEVHWRVHWADATHAETLLDMALGGDEAQSAAAELAVLLLCYARDGFVGVRLASDLAGWWDARGDALAPRALDAFGTAHQGLLGILATAAVVAERVCGIPAGAILGPAGLARASRGGAALADPVAAGDVQQLRAQQVAVDLHLLAPGGGGAFVRRQLADGRRLARRRDRLTHVPKTTLRVAAALAGARLRSARD